MEEADLAAAQTLYRNTENIQGVEYHICKRNCQTEDNFNNETLL